MENRNIKYNYAVVTNVPHTFRAADLRAHFSSLVESRSFVCFHFRHRPEKDEEDSARNDPDVSETSQQTTLSTRAGSDTNRTKRCCCVVKIQEENLAAFLKYNGTNWTDKTDEFYGEICRVSLIHLAGSPSQLSAEDSQCHNKSETIEETTLLKMAELRPPELMPQGNVGTPTLVFLDLIQRCLLPDTLIRKLDLKFPKTRSKRLYDSVNYHYQTSSRQSKKSTDHSERNNLRATQASDSADPCSGLRSESCALVKTSGIDNPVSHSTLANSEGSNNRGSEAEIERVGDECEVKKLSEVEGCEEVNKNLVGSHAQALMSANPQDSDLTRHDSQRPPPVLTNRQKKAQQKAERQRTRQLMAENIEENLIAVEKAEQRATEEAGEEWDRHEASENDPSNQERNKERLYEEEIEQPWEKGGPGVVFYTDAMFWQEKEGDFDEQTTDDLDVDFSAYEEGLKASDMDMQDFHKIRQEQRFRNGYDKTDRFSIGIGKRIPPSASGSQSWQKGKVGEFEKHSKGFGRKVMERQGWRDGKGLGRSQQGMAQALRGEGQSARNKRGIGYVEEEPVQFGPGHKKAKQHLITTVYDHPHQTDPKEPLLQRSEPTTLKHRAEHVDSFLRKNKKS